MATTTSPVRSDARLDGEPGRWLWLVKWLLLVPHHHETTANNVLAMPSRRHRDA